MSYICGFGSITSAESCRKVTLTAYSSKGHKYVKILGSGRIEDYLDSLKYLSSIGTREASYS